MLFVYSFFFSCCLGSRAGVISDEDLVSDLVPDLVPDLVSDVPELNQNGQRNKPTIFVHSRVGLFSVWNQKGTKFQPSRLLSSLAPEGNPAKPK